MGKAIQQTNNKVTPPGAAIDWTDEQLDQLARVTVANIADAKRDLARRDPALARELEGKGNDATG
jgi:hypothetical protein